MTDTREHPTPERPEGITDQQWEDYLSQLRRWEDTPPDHFDGKPNMPVWPTPHATELPEGSILN